MTEEQKYTLIGAQHKIVLACDYLTSKVREVVRDIRKTPGLCRGNVSYRTRLLDDERRLVETQVCCVADDEGKLADACQYYEEHMEPHFLTLENTILLALGKSNVPNKRVVAKMEATRALAIAVFKAVEAIIEAMRREHLRVSFKIKTSTMAQKAVTLSDLLTKGYGAGINLNNDKNCINAVNVFVKHLLSNDMVKNSLQATETETD